MHKFTAPHWATMIYRASGYLTEEFGGGPKFLKMAWVINLHKIITLFDGAFRPVTVPGHFAGRAIPPLPLIVSVCYGKR
jgi:hypothetical protein